MNLLLGAVLCTTIYGLWMRRRTFGCRWEGAKTLAAVSAAAAAYLTSAPASRLLSEPLHRVTGVWNFEDLLGHVFAITCSMTAVYIFLIRFGDDGDDRICRYLYATLVLRPLTVVVPIMLACRAFAKDSYNENFDAIEPGFWLGCYWVILVGVGFWLLGLAGWLLLRLRDTDGQDRHDMVVINLYLAAIVTTILMLVLLFFQVFSPYDIRVIVWPVAYLSVVCWTVAPAYSWRHRSRPLRIAAADQLRKLDPAD